MRFRPQSFLLLVLCAIALWAAAAASENWRLLVGTWSGGATRADGMTVSTVFELTEDRRFTGRGTINGQVSVTFSGRWEVRDNRLVWHYERMSPPLFDVVRVDVDEIVSVDRDRLVLVNQRTGQRHQFTRSKYH